MKRLLEQPLGGSDWSDGWFVERWIASRLSRRERAIVECLVGERPNWTVGWCVGLVALVTLTALVILWALAARGEEDRLGLYMLANAGSCVAVLFGCIHMPRNRRRQPNTFAILPLVPLGFRELLFTSLKVAACRLALWLPTLAAALLLSGLCLGRPGELLAAGLATVVGATVTLALVGPVFRFGSRTRYEFSLHRCAFLFAWGLSFVLAQPLLIAPFWWLTTAIAAVMLALAVIGAIHYDWLHRTGRIDYRTELPAQSSRVGSLWRQAVFHNGKKLLPPKTSDPLARPPSIASPVLCAKTPLLRKPWFFSDFWRAWDAGRRLDGSLCPLKRYGKRGDCRIRMS